MAHKIFFNYKRTKVGETSRYCLKQVIQVNITSNETMDLLCLLISYTGKDIAYK